MINGLYKPNAIRGQPGPGTRKWHKRFNTRHQLPQLGGRAHLFWFSHKRGSARASWVRSGGGSWRWKGVVFWDEDKWG